MLYSLSICKDARILAKRLRLSLKHQVYKQSPNHRMTAEAALWRYLYTRDYGLPQTKSPSHSPGPGQQTTN